MQVTITGGITDSAGNPANGRLEVTQAQRFDTGEVLVTGATTLAQVVAGEIRALDGALFKLPANPDGTAVRIRELLGGRTFEWWASVPAVDAIAYRELTPVESPAVPASVWGAPPWLREAQQMRDETVAAIADGAEIAATLGGLPGLQQLAADSEAAAAEAQSAAVAAHSEADRAEVAAASVDMAAINQRLDQADADIAQRPTSPEVSDLIAAAFAPPMTEGVKVYSYGHSYTFAPNPWCTPNGGEYGHRVADRIGASERFLRGRSGTPVMDTLALALNAGFDTQTVTPRAWTPGSRGIVLVQNYMNEMPLAYGGDAKFKDMWLRSMRSLLALFSAQSVATISSLTRRGTWTAYSNDIGKMFASADVMFANSVGAEVDATVTGDAAWILTSASSNAYALGSFDVLCGGKVISTVSPNGINYSYQSVVSSVPREQWVYAAKVSGLNAAAGTAGSKTITIRTKSTSPVFINGVMQPSVEPPQIFLGREPLRSPNASSGNAAYVANRPAYDLMAQQVAGEFPNVHLVDLDVGWDVGTMVYSGDPGKHHPNDLGMRCLADNFTRAIRQQITGPTPGVHYL